MAAPATTAAAETARFLVRRTTDAVQRARRVVIDAQFLCSKAQDLRRFARVLRRHG